MGVVGDNGKEHPVKLTFRAFPITFDIEICILILQRGPEIFSCIVQTRAAQKYRLASRMLPSPPISTDVRPASIFDI